MGGIGSDGRTSRNVWSYDPLRGDWTEREPLPTPRRLFGCCASEDTIYLAGGWGESPKACREVFRYRPDIGWDLLCYLPAACAMNGLFPTEGGLLSLDAASGAAHRYSFAADRWEVCARLPVSIRGGGMCSAGRSIVISGGFNRKHDYLDTVWACEPE